MNTSQLTMKSAASNASRTVLRRKPFNKHYELITNLTICGFILTITAMWVFYFAGLGIL